MTARPGAMARPQFGDEGAASDGVPIRFRRVRWLLSVILVQVPGLVESCRRRTGDGAPRNRGFEEGGGCQHWESEKSVGLFVLCECYWRRRHGMKGEGEGAVSRGKRACEECANNAAAAHLVGNGIIGLLPCQRLLQGQGQALKALQKMACM